MSRSLSSAQLTELNAAGTSAVLPILIQISHADLASTLYYCNNLESLTYGGTVYTARAFEFTPPPESNSMVGRGSLVIDNVDRVITAALRPLTTPPTVVAIATFYYDVGTTVFTELASWNLEMESISYDATTVRCELIYDMKLDSTVPYLKMTPAYFPGVH